MSFARYIDNKLAIEIGMFRGATSRVDEIGIYLPLSQYTDYTNVSARGIRAGVIWGWNIQQRGWRAYTGLGIYHERAKMRRETGGNIEDRLNGFMVKLGGGYKWQHVGVDFWVSFRSGEAKGFEENTGMSGLQLSYSY